MFSSPARLKAFKAALGIQVRVLAFLNIPGLSGGESGLFQSQVHT